MGELLLDLFSEQITTDYNKIRRFIPFLGGGSANVAACLARQGIPAAFVSLLGQDPVGDMLIGFLCKNRVDVSHIKRAAGLPSGVIFITRDNSKERYFYALPSFPSCLDFTENNISPGFLKKARYFHLGSSNLVGDDARRATFNILAECKKRGILVSFDLNLRPGNWKNGRISRPVILKAMKAAAVVKANNEELSFVLRQKNYIKAAENLSKKVPLVFVSLGKNGALAFQKGKYIKQKATRVKVIDTTGAGDAFCAGYLSELYRLGISKAELESRGLSEKELNAVLAAAIKLGGIAATKLGAVEGLPYRK